MQPLQQRQRSIKKLLCAMTIVALLLPLSACVDDFSEKDLFEQQLTTDDDKAEVNAAALAQAGHVLDYNVHLHVDNAPVSGVNVTLTHQNEGATVSTVTDELGNANFVDIALGGHVVSITSPDYLKLSFIVDFGSIQDGVHYQWMNGLVVPIETSESSKVEMLSTTDMQQTATIKGHVQIETDLLNQAHEIPQGISLRANLDASLNASHSFVEEDGVSRSIFVEGSFSFTEGNVGIAAVDNVTGAYSMQVPASVAGSEIQLLYPLVETEQRLAFSQKEGLEVGPQTGLVQTQFGPNITASTTPDVPGVFVEFDAPPPPGRGFAVNTTNRRRNSIIPGLFSGLIDDFPLEEDLVNSIFRFTNGSGYQISPTIETFVPETVDVLPEIRTNMSWEFYTVNITSGGSGYMQGQDVSIVADFTLENNNVVSQVIGSVEAGSGSLPLGPVDLYTEVSTQHVYDISLRFHPLPGIPPTGSLDYGGIVTAFEVVSSGLGYTSVPEFEISGGNPEVPATLEVVDMAFKYFFEPDNSNVTQPYVVLPQIQYEYATSPTQNIFNTTAIAANVDSNGDVASSQVFPEGVQDFLKVYDYGLDFNQEIPILGEEEIFGTVDFFSFTEPKFIVTEPEHPATTADLVITDGKITGLDNIVVGRGYDEPYTLRIRTLEGVSGSDAHIELHDFTVDERTTEVSWSGDFIVANGGNGYFENANIAEEPFEGPTEITIKRGETKIVNINYGTGKTTLNLD